MTTSRHRPVRHLAAALALAALLPSVTDAADDAAVERPRLAVPRLATAPTIDGEMAPGEWDRAAAVSGFIGATGDYGKVVVPKESRIHLAQDGETLYLAVWTELAPGEKPTMQYRRRDSKVYMDRQQFEIWLTPPTAGHETSYQLIGNAYGALYDLKKVESLGITTPAWNPDLAFENSYQVGSHWIAEIAIPFAAVADPDHYLPDEPWGGMVAVAWPQRSWPFTHGWYKNTSTHALMRMRDDGTCARLLDFSSLFDNRLAPTLELVNDGAEDATFTLRARRKDFAIERPITVPAGAVHRVELDEALPEAAKRHNAVFLQVEGPDGGDLIAGDWYYRPLATAERVAEQVEPEAWSLQTRVAYAPLTKAARCWADVLDAPMRDDIAAVRWTVSDESGAAVPITDPFGTTAEELRDETFELDAAETHLWLPEDLPYGDYVVTTAYLDASGKVLAEAEDRFTHRDHRADYPWLGSDSYGEDFTVAPPFEPLRRDGDTLTVWGRRYRFEGALPSAIESQDQAMLARPVQLVAVVDGAEQVAEATRPFDLDGGISDVRARFGGGYRVAGLEIDLSGELFYDGALTYTLAATPGEAAAAVDRLYLSVPVDPAVAQSLLSNRGGGGGGYQTFLADLPAGDGVIWTSAKLADFVPYLGVCDDDRALQWFADHDHDWILGEDHPCAQVVRRDGALELQINLVRRRSVGEGLRAEFGLIASPVKPLPSGWRNTVLHYAPMAGSTINFFYGPGHGNTGPFKWHDSAGLAKANGIAIPEGEDARVVLDRMSGEGYPDLEAIERAHGAKPSGWVAKALASNADPTAVKQCFFHNASMYFEGNASQAFRTFFEGEWSIVPSGGWFHLRPVESYQDFFLFHLTQHLKFWGVPGVYYDECYFAPDKNVFNGHGRILADGSIRPSVGLMHQRRLIHRTRQCMVDAGVDPFVWVHTSDFMAPYAIAAADIAMFGEPNIPTPQQDIIDNIRPSYMRSIGRSQKFGFVPVWMTMAGRGGEQWSLAGRQTFGWCWIHDTVPEVHTHFRGRPLVDYRAQWGIARDDVAFHAYWNQTAAASDDQRIIASYWSRPRDDAAGRSVLLLAMNLHYRDEQVTTATLTIDPEALGVGDDYRVYHLESMPGFREREEVLRACDRASGYGARAIDRDPRAELGADRFFWRDQPGYRLDQLEVVERTGDRITVEIPARDFVHLVVE